MVFLRRFRPFDLNVEQACVLALSLPTEAVSPVATYSGLQVHEGQ